MGVPPSETTALIILDISSLVECNGILSLTSILCVCCRFEVKSSEAHLSKCYVFSQISSYGGCLSFEILYNVHIAIGIGFSELLKRSKFREKRCKYNFITIINVHRSIYQNTTHN